MCEEENDHDDFDADGGEGGHQQLVHVVEGGVALGGGNVRANGVEVRGEVR